MQADHLPITGPCPIRLDPFAEGDGESTEHFCDRCAKDVHVLSNMREADARRFLHAHAGQNLCIAYKVDQSGAIRYKDDDCSELDATVAAHQLPRGIVPVTALSRMRRATSGRGSGPMLALALAACTPHSEPVLGQVRVEETQVRGNQQPVVALDPSGNPMRLVGVPKTGPEPDAMIFAGEAPIVDLPPPVEQVMAGGITAPPTQPSDPTLVRNTEGLPEPFPGAKEGDTPCDPDKASEPIRKSPKSKAMAGGARMPTPELEPMVGDMMVPEEP